ncbi:hypothetical protein [Thermococcus sp.]
MTYIPPAGGEIGIGPETVWTSPDVLIATEAVAATVAAALVNLAVADNVAAAVDLVYVVV